MGYAYEAGGKEFHLREAFATGGAIELPVEHFSGEGVGSASATDVEHMQQDHVPSDAGAKAAQDVVNGRPIDEAVKLYEKAIKYLRRTEGNFRFFPEARDAVWQYLGYLRDHKDAFPADAAKQMQDDWRACYWRCLGGAYLECVQGSDSLALAMLYQWSMCLRVDRDRGYFALADTPVTEADLADWRAKIQACDRWRVWCGSGKQINGVRNLLCPQAGIRVNAIVPLALTGMDASRPAEGTGTCVQRVEMRSTWWGVHPGPTGGWVPCYKRLYLDGSGESPCDLVVTLQPYLWTYAEYRSGMAPVHEDSRGHLQPKAGRPPELLFGMVYESPRFPGTASEIVVGDPTESWVMESGAYQFENFPNAAPPEGPDDYFSSPGGLWVTRVREWDTFDPSSTPMASQTYGYFHENIDGESGILQSIIQEATHFEIALTPLGSPPD